MLRWIGAITAGIVIIIGLPIAAIAVSKATAPEPWDPEATIAAQAAAAIVGEDEAAVVAPTEGTDQDANDQATTSQIAPQTQQRFRIHSETGPPEGFEPIRQRLHQQEQAAANGGGRSEDALGRDNAPGRGGPPDDRGDQGGRGRDGRGTMQGQGGQHGMAGRGGPRGADGAAGECTHGGPGARTCPNATNS